MHDSMYATQLNPSSQRISSTISDERSAVAIPQFIFRSNDRNNVLQVDLPGISEPGNIIVELDNERLTIVGLRNLPYYRELPGQEEENFTEDNEKDDISEGSEFTRSNSNGSSTIGEELNVENELKRRRTTDFNKVDKIVYKRVFRLGRRIDQGKISVRSFKHGVLTILMPNLEKTLPRRIPVHFQEDQKQWNDHDVDGFRNCTFKGMDPTKDIRAVLKHQQPN